jgi:fatty acid desaturase
METENKTNFYSKKSLKMEVIIQKTGWLLYLLNRKGKELLSTRVLRNHTSVILFIMLVCFITFLITFWAWGYPVLKIIIYTSTTLMMLFVALIFVGSWHEAKRLCQNEFISCFHFNRSNINGFSYRI